MSDSNVSLRKRMSRVLPSFLTPCSAWNAGFGVAEFRTMSAPRQEAVTVPPIILNAEIEVDGWLEGGGAGAAPGCAGGEGCPSSVDGEVATGAGRPSPISGVAVVRLDEPDGSAGDSTSPRAEPWTTGGGGTPAQVSAGSDWPSGTRTWIEIGCEDPMEYRPTAIADTARAAANHCKAGAIRPMAGGLRIQGNRTAGDLGVAASWPRIHSSKSMRGNLRVREGVPEWDRGPT
jgi:hypothetical protein